MLTSHCDGLGYRSLSRAMMHENGRSRIANELFTACSELCRVQLNYEYLEHESWYARSASVARDGDTILIQ